MKLGILRFAEVNLTMPLILYSLLNSHHEIRWTLFVIPLFAIWTSFEYFNKSQHLTSLAFVFVYSSDPVWKRQISYCIDMFIWLFFYPVVMLVFSMV